MKYIPSSSYGAPGASSAIPQLVQRKRTFHIFGFIATTLLVISLLSSAGIFFYQKELEKQLAQAKEGLKKVSSDNDNAKKINELESFDLKLKTAEMLLDNHRAPSKLFTELERNTNKTVQLTSLAYKYDPGFDIELELGASTDELTSVFFQKRKIIEENLFSTVIVNGISSSLDTPSEDNTVQTDIEDKKIKFAIKGLLKDEVVAYDGKRSVQQSITPASVASSSESVAEPVEESTGTTTDNDIIE